MLKKCRKKTNMVDFCLMLFFCFLCTACSKNNFDDNGSVYERSRNDNESVEYSSDNEEQIELIDHVIDWKDMNLENAIRELTGIENGDIMLSDVWEFSSLTLDYKGIDNIEALGELRNLQFLSLSDNNISNIDALGQLDNLRTLLIYDNNVENIDALGELPKLRTLGLDCHNINDISILGNLNLTSLGLSGNNIDELTGFDKLTSLTDLSLDCQNASRVFNSTMGGMKSLKKLS